MMELSLSGLAPIVVILFAAFIAGFVKGVTTMGLGLLAVPIIALFLDVQTAVLSLFASKFLSDIVMLLETKQDVSWRSASRLSWFVLSGAIAIPAATYLFAILSGKYLDMFLALTILGFVLVQVSPRATLLKLPEDRRFGAGFGAAAGASQALTGVGGPYTAMYLYTLKLTASEFVFLSSVIYLLFDCSQLAAILYLGLYDRSRLVYSSAMLVPVMAGTWLGIRYRRRLDAHVFRSALLALLAASGIGLFLRATIGFFR